MSSPVVTASPDDNLIAVIDRMVKTGSRRVPVVDGNTILGIVYLSDVFHHFCASWLDESAAEN
jgi:CBS domain-containing protein